MGFQLISVEILQKKIIPYLIDF